MTLTQDQIAQLKKAPDLVIATEFEKTKQGRRPSATTYSSHRLGLEYREKYVAAQVANESRERWPTLDSSSDMERPDEGKEASLKIKRSK